MRKFFLHSRNALMIILLMNLLVFSVYGQTFSISPSNIQSVDVSCDSMMTQNVITINNSSTSNINLSYVVLINSLPSDTLWNYQFCNWEQCFLTLPSGKRDVSIPVTAGTQTATLTLDLKSNTHQGGGVLSLMLYQTEVPTNSVVVTWTAAACVNGVREIGKTTDFVIYPNPAVDLVNISITQGYSSTAQLALYNYMGKRITEYSNVGGNNQELDLSNLPTGVYFVKYSTPQGTSVKKLYKIK